MADLTEVVRRCANAEERIGLARQALIRDGYFTADQVDDDIAPRIIELASHLRIEASTEPRVIGREAIDSILDDYRFEERERLAAETEAAKSRRRQDEMAVKLVAELGGDVHAAAGLLGDTAEHLRHISGISTAGG